MTRHELMRALDAVEEEYRAATAAVSRVLELAERDPTVLHALDIERRSLLRCRTNLERTYLVRLFAVFEERLRELWSSWGKQTRPKAEDLIQGCSARQKVDARIVIRTHAIRLYRNSVVHGGDAEVVSLGEARSGLCRFVGWMPPAW